MKKKEELAYSRALVPRRGKIYKKIVICVLSVLLIVGLVSYFYLLGKM